MFDARSISDDGPAAAVASRAAVWVVTLSAEDDALGRVGDAREIADRLGAGVAVLMVERADNVDERRCSDWIRHGADEVHVRTIPAATQEGRLAAAEACWRQAPPRLVLAAADGIGRAWSARLAARTGWPLVSPALLVQVKSGQLTATRLDAAGQRARRIDLPADRPAIVALRPGVAQPWPADDARQGSVTVVHEQAGGGRAVSVERIAADPGSSDIRHLSKLICGGKGVGSRAGFDLLRRVAAQLGAGVAASRMAVDLGWIEYERQVGQTGKTVRPDLYIACGVSGASHHLEGMADSRHIVAINTDPGAPLVQKAHLALVGDLHPILEQLHDQLGHTA